VTTGRYDSRLIAASGVASFPVSISFAPEGDSSRLRIANATDSWLRSAFYWRKGRAWAVGDIPPSSGRSLLLAPADGLDLHAEGALKRVNGSDRRVSFWNLVSAEADADGGFSSEGVFAAWLDAPALPFTSSGALRAKDRPTLSLLLVEAP
jgi:hypothetical protein